MTIKETQRAMAKQLASAVGPGEASAMASAIIEDVRGYKPVDVALYGHREVEPETLARMQAIVDKVIAGMPLQYAIGSAKFHGRAFAVTPDTLIPRPETSQLVDIIEKDYAGRPDLRILDVGTGTGCIAISLALDLPFAQVTGIDISPAAIGVAASNASALHARNAQFKVADALRLRIRDDWDIIVSNPPYIMESEKAGMDAVVKDYEPATALFVPDSQPLLFYKPIAQYAYDNLQKGGRIYFEINPLCAAQLKTMLDSIGFAKVEIVRDYKGANRFAIAQK